jgi:hypothetical protein
MVRLPPRSFDAELFGFANWPRIRFSTRNVRFLQDAGARIY